MAGKKGTSAPPRKRPIERYEHTDKKRINNPQVGLVTPETDPVAPTHKTYDYVTPVPRRTSENRAARQRRQSDQLLPRGTAGRNALAACRRRDQRCQSRTRGHLLRPGIQ